MYESYFGFAKRPFLTVPTLDRYFPASSMEQAYQNASRAILRAEGPVAIFGGTGLGKTMCCLRIADSFRKHYEVVTLASSQIITRRALLQSLLYELRMPYRDLSEGELRLTLMNRIQPSVENPAEGLVLIVDEAQTLSTKLLDELRLLTNVVRNGIPRIRLVLCGTMKLEDILAHPHMESLNQRLAARCYLTPLGSEETSRYVIHKVELSGVSIAEVMTRDALDAIYRGSDGIPRLIDQLADQSLLIAATENIRPITAAVVSQAWCMLQQLPNPWSEPESMPKSTSSLAPSTQINSTSDASPAFTVFAPSTPIGNATTSNAIEFGSLEDDSIAPRVNAAVTPSSGVLEKVSSDTWSYELAAEEEAPLTIDPQGFDFEKVQTLEELASETASSDSTLDQLPSFAVPASTVEEPSSNLLSVFSDDFDEEFSIPVQSSSSYQSYSGMAYGNLNYDLNHFTPPKSAQPSSEANHFLEWHDHASSEKDTTHSMPVAKDDRGLVEVESDVESNLVSNVTPERFLEIEMQIEEEMRELVSSMNLNAMTMDPERDIESQSESGSSRVAERSHESAQPTTNRSRKESVPSSTHSRRSDSGALTFTGLHESAVHDRSSFGDDRDLLVVEEDVSELGVANQVATSRATLPPYAQLFAKLRQS